MHKQISLFKKADDFTVNLSLANTRSPRKNTIFKKIATAKLYKNECSIFTQLRTISNKSHAQTMSKRLQGMRINPTYTAVDNQHMFILDETTSFLFVVDMNARSISFVKISDRIFVDGQHDPLYRDFCQEIAKQTKPTSYKTPCPLDLAERPNKNIVVTDPNPGLLAKIEEQDALITQLYAEVEELKAAASVNSSEASQHLHNEENSCQKEIDDKIKLLAINYNQDLLKLIKPLVMPEQVEYLEEIVKLIDRGKKILPDRFSNEKIVNYYPLMFSYKAIIDTEELIAQEEYRLACEALINKDWSEEEQQFQQLDV
ncbi:TPA: hypothetical protein ACPVZ9_001524 [Vibrio parahaemolyticus]